jgi:ADP-ribose pyrophosphatase YjhB (NUDIX family)
MADPPPYLDSTGRPISRMPEVIRPGVNAVIFGEPGRVLLERRSDNGFWGLPGGGVDIAESVEDAVIREAFEETGLLVTVERLTGIYSDPRYQTITSYPDGGLVHYVTMVFACRRTDGELRISEESTDIGYFDVDAMPKDTLASHTERIRDALADRATPVLK